MDIRNFELKRSLPEYTLNNSRAIPRWKAKGLAEIIG